MESIEEEIIYLGPRGPSFKDLIVGLLTRGNLKPKYISMLTSEKNMGKYGQAFTAASANKKINYEMFEQIGDMAANSFIVSYSYRRFPQLLCPLGVKVVARLRINYGSKQSFAPIAEKLGFWDFISAQVDGVTKGIKYRNRNKKDLLEDCLESFFGCTQELLDNEYRIGVGYAIVYDILKNIFDELPMSLDYYDLYDSKTIMKEIFDPREDELGSWTFLENRIDQLTESRVYRIPPGVSKDPIQVSFGMGKKDFNLDPQRGWLLLGSGKAATKKDAEQKAARVGLQTLKREGYEKRVPDEYKLFCD